MENNSGIFTRIQETPENLKTVAKKKLNQPGWRFGHITARVTEAGSFVVETLLLNTREGKGLVIESLLPENNPEYPSLTPDIPAAHRAERALGDFFGITAKDHPHWHTLILSSDAWEPDLTPLSPTCRGKREPFLFTNVTGEGVHEIPVGPIHAGIIEPGHFRFSCAGEIITHMDIRLGYQHRGVEKRLTEINWQNTRFTAESNSSDTAAGNALAHSIAIEQIADINPPERAQYLRTISLELERLANHIGDMGALSGDIGFSAGAALFSQNRGYVLGMAQLLTGKRTQRYYIKPGGVSRDADSSTLKKLAENCIILKKTMKEHIPLVLENSAVIERMENTGILSQRMAKDFGIVGPAGRASGSGYDARTVFPHGVFPEYAPAPAFYKTGDVLSRAKVKADEIFSSIEIIEKIIANIPAGEYELKNLPSNLRPESYGIGITEAWRGELIHWITTDSKGKISRYSIKDPSFNNWTGLGIAVRGNLVADFPLCNKSFNLSYSGSDL
ncbi:MAG: NADH-quinone oxidoreductase subunit C [Firmicutes bacterium]|nr:NADH-quinone oxidoreductase subunit C [Bacillota bacterium]